MPNYGLKSVLRETLNALLQEYFQKRGLLGDFKWSRTDGDGKEIPLGETDMDGLEKAILSLDGGKQWRVEEDFREITMLASVEGNECLIDQAASPLHRIDLVAEYKAGGIVAPYDRVMWVWLRHSDLFEFTVKFQNVVRTKGAHEFEAGRGLACAVDEAAMSALKAATIEYYQSKGRGEKCLIDYYQRRDPERYCYYVHHEDSVKTATKFNEDGTALVRDPQESVFENVFFYEPDSGVVRIHAGNTKNAGRMAELFCIHILGLPGVPDKTTEVYDLSKLKDENFRFELGPELEGVSLKEVVLDMGDLEEVVLQIKGREQRGMLLQARMAAVARAYGKALADVRVRSACIQVAFKKVEGRRKMQPRTREIGPGNHTNLSDDWYDNVIRYHIEKVWKLRRRLLDAAEAA